MPLKSLDLKLVDQFHSEDACREVLAEIRWPDGVKCPRCDGERHAYDSERYVWDCYSCGYQFSVMSGTILHDTKLPLRKWFMATLLTVEAKKGMSANQVKRTLGVSYKTAWYLCHRIRAAMKEASPTPLTGIIEADETWIGGRKRGTPRGKWRETKTMVLGVVERDGQVRLRVDKRRPTKAVLHEFLNENVGEVVALYTDEHGGYKGFTANHGSVVHWKEEWVRGEVHTNTVEGVWGLFKRSIVGSFHQLSVKHLDAYLDEFEWRFNNRENEYLFRDTLMALLRAETLEYKALVATTP